MKEKPKKEKKEKQPFPQEYLLVSEQGTGNYKTKVFGTESNLGGESEAEHAAAALKCCWVLFRKEGTELLELKSGGVGMAHGSIRKYATKTFTPNAIVHESESTAAPSNLKIRA